MAKINADNPDLEKALLRLEKLTIQGGGWLNPDLIIRGEEGSLSVEMAGEQSRDQKLVVLNREVLLPIEQMTITSKNGTFSYEPADEKKFTKLRRELADVVFEIYNLTNKHELCAETDFWLNMSQNHDVLDRVAQARTMRDPAVKFLERVKKGFEGEERETFVASRFIGSRVLGFGRGENDTLPADQAVKISKKTANQMEASKKGKAGPGLMSVIMPFIDFFNHHCYGSRFICQDENSLEVRNIKPVPDSNECYAFYGVMDPLDAYIRYGFIDQSATVVRSIPLKIDIPDLGRIVVHSAMPNNMKKPHLKAKAKDLEDFLPAMQRQQDILTISHLFIPVDGSPFALKRVLAICIATLTGKPFDKDKQMHLVRDAEEFVKQENIKFFKDLGAFVEQTKKDKGSDPAVENTELLAKTLLRMVESYQTEVQAA